MPTPLRNRLDELARSFTSSVHNAIRGASIEELLVDGGRPGRGARRSRQGGLRTQTSPRTAKRAGRLGRRSPEQIADVLASVVALLKGKKTSLRSEDIQRALKLDRRELPRVLKEGLARRALKRRGVKRATTYAAA